MTTCFNGASNVVQAGGLACLSVSACPNMHALIIVLRAFALCGVRKVA